MPRHVRLPPRARVDLLVKRKDESLLVTTVQRHFPIKVDKRGPREDLSTLKRREPYSKTDQFGSLSKGHSRSLRRSEQGSHLFVRENTLQSEVWVHTRYLVAFVVPHLHRQLSGP